MVLPASKSILVFMLTFIITISSNRHRVKPYPLCPTGLPAHGIPVYKGDIDWLQFPLNLEYLEAEFFLWGSLGLAWTRWHPSWPGGAQKANLDPFTWRLIEEFGYQEVGHLRAIRTTVGGFPRPLMDLSAKNFKKLFDEAFGYKLEPPFDPYCDSLSFVIASYVIPYVGLVGYVGTNPNLIGYMSKRLLAGLLGMEAGQDAVIREYLYKRAFDVVHPYNYTVAEFTNRISELRNRLAKCGIKDEGLIVPRILGAESRTKSNVLAAERNSLSDSRTPGEILRVVYGSGDEHVPGGFYPRGASGKIAKWFLYKP